MSKFFDGAKREGKRGEDREIRVNLKCWPMLGERESS